MTDYDVIPTTMADMLTSPCKYVASEGAAGPLAPGVSTGFRNPVLTEYRVSKPGTHPFDSQALTHSSFTYICT